MASRRTAADLGRYVLKENGGVQANRGSAYLCSQFQIDAYTLKPYCYLGMVDHPMTERESHQLLGSFLNPNRTPASDEIFALRRLRDAVLLERDDWHPDIVIKALPDIDTAFFNGMLRGNIKVQWVDDALLDANMRGPRGPAIVMANTRYLHPRQPHGCTSIWLSLQGVLEPARNPRQRMWQALFHELIHAYVLATCHRRPPTPYDRAKGWLDGHGLLFRLCLRALEVRTVRYLDLEIGSIEDIRDFRSLD
ncbi:hypothetical protein MMC07_005724 [Pseudocyphellaria aurata]|nr:hypothetical protein [Pseudocyphellaria aurata]